MATRYGTGATFATLFVAGAAIASDRDRLLLTALFCVMALLILVGTFAPKIPGLHRFPVIGAPRVTIELTRDDGQPLLLHGPTAETVLSVGVFNHGPGEVLRARINVLVPEPVEIQACDPFGQPVQRGSWMRATSEELLPGRESPYWSDRLDLDEDATPIYYRLTIPEEGEFPIRVKLKSKSLYQGVELTETLAVTAGGPPPSDPKPH